MLKIQYKIFDTLKIIFLNFFVIFQLNDFMLSVSNVYIYYTMYIYYI